MIIKRRKRTIEVRWRVMARSSKRLKRNLRLPLKVVSLRLLKRQMLKKPDFRNLVTMYKSYPVRSIALWRNSIR